MIKYFNTKTNGEVETVDEIDPKDYPDTRAFKKEVKRLLMEYNLAFHGGVYVSTRATKDYTEVGK